MHLEMFESFVHKSIPNVLVHELYTLMQPIYLVLGEKNRTPYKDCVSGTFTCCHFTNIKKATF